MFDWDDNPDLNITPLVDVMLVLMAILMVTAPTINFEEKITLPQGSSSKKLDNIKTLTIRIDKNKIVYFGKDKYPIDKFADFFVLKSNKFSPDDTVFIHADENLPYKYVMELLKIIKELKFTKVSLVTE
ncbi:Biopolymer transport protein ExbD/TolR [hydrothermal vent metagenome]|uniref:Biopolymer transport protein ExbD/TolR n=1 Tax=hydrothermal vent metagenome TaxID=652676 RepID=A0A1W1BM00_9ZZZZ